jgi:hypothetical protein
MTAIADRIAEELATLTRVTPTPTAPFGYGSDLSCIEDLTDDMEELDPFSVRGIGEAVIRRLITQRGTLQDDPEYGHDVREYLNRGMTTADIGDAQTTIRNEIAKDDRVADSSVTLRLETLTSLTVSIVLTPADPNITPFALTFAVTDGAVVVEALG